MLTHHAYNNNIMQVDREVEDDTGTFLRDTPHHDHDDDSMIDEDNASASPGSIVRPIASPLNSAPNSPSSELMSPGWGGHQSPMGSAPNTPQSGSAPPSPSGSAPASPGK